MASKLYTGVVKDIILNDKDGKAINAIGVYTKHAPNQLLTAFPFDSNIKRVPLKGETVVLFGALGPDAKPEDVTPSTRLYYLNPTSLQNSIHNNALPGAKTVEVTDRTSEYGEISVGNPNRSITNTRIDLGKGFVEVTGLSPLQPFIGDVLFEGRFGHSIRFGYTPQTSDTTKRPTWQSRKPESPITIVSNGRRSLGAGKYTIEDINEDDSSIWLSSTQTLPLKPSQTLALGVTPQKIYDKPTIAVNSDRIFLNSKSDYIILTGAKSVNISTPNWAADMDKIFTILEGVVQQLADLASAKATFATGTGPTGPATNLAQINQLLIEIKKMAT